MKIKKNLPLISSLALACLLSGCVAVPANRIQIEGPSGSYVIRTPKNVLIENFKASFPTNGALSIEFSKWSSTNDAQVIDRAALGQAEIIKQWGSIVTNAVAAGAAAALH